MSERITLQDIADALGLSRNTVSKAINNTGSIADETRSLVLKKAAEMGYKQFSYIDISAKKLTIGAEENGLQGAQFVLLMTSWVDSSHFASTLIDRIQYELSLLGASLAMYRVLPDELMQCRLPASLDLTKIRGIFCTEIFHIPYARMLTHLEIPVVFFDSPVMYSDAPLEADIVLMDNTNYAYPLIRKLADEGCRHFGFVGPIRRCRSFYERYTAFRQALDYWGLAYDPSLSYLGPDSSTPDAPDEVSETNLAKLRSFVESLPACPDAFLCANDFVALDILRICREKGIEVPGSLKLCGFDDSAESRIITPTFTTVHIHSQIMGVTAVELMVSRIREPDLYYRTIHTQADLVLRASTEPVR